MIYLLVTSSALTGYLHPVRITSPNIALTEVASGIVVPCRPVLSRSYVRPEADSELTNRHVTTR